MGMTTLEKLEELIYHGFKEARPNQNAQNQQAQNQNRVYRCLPKTVKMRIADATTKNHTGLARCFHNFQGRIEIIRPGLWGSD